MTKRQKPSTATTIMPTINQLLTRPSDMIAEKLLELPTISVAKIISLLPADKAAEIIEAMKEKMRKDPQREPPKEDEY